MPPRDARGIMEAVMSDGTLPTHPTRVYVYVCALVSDPAEVEVLLNKREEDGFGVSSRGRQAGKAF